MQLNNNKGTKTMEAIEDMAVALASQNSQLVAGKLLARVTLVRKKLRPNLKGELLIFL